MAISSETKQALRASKSLQSDLWGLRKKRGDTWLPLLVAGPCSAETEEQVMKTAHALAKDERVNIFRAGVWKPRTRPNNFEGRGVEALPWLQRVKEETGLKVGVEVAHAHHVEACLNAGIDVLWVGARTTVSPFAVQELASAMQGADVPVMIKNPVTPDLGLWAGAVERFEHAGINKILAVHRGFTTFEKTKYRNAPQWPLAIEFKRQFPDMPIIVDPSHIAGNTVLLLHIVQQALDLAYDGMMIETHPNPAEAWSDAKQQITPEQLGDLLTTVVLKKPNPQNANVVSSLELLREQIDNIDQTLLQLLAQRMELVEEIGTYKKENNITVLQLNRWNEIIGRITQKAQELGLTERISREIFTAIHAESILIQEKTINPAPDEN